MPTIVFITLYAWTYSHAISQTIQKNSILRLLLMPKKFLKRFIPSQQFIKEHPSLRFMGPMLGDPNLFHLNRYSVSMAFLVGMFLAFLPMPAQMIAATIVALWVRCNLPIAIALVWITNPITIPPIFFATYSLGAWVLDTPTMNIDMSFSWEWINEELSRVWKPLLTGSLITGVFCGVTSYTAINLIWRWRVIHHWKKRKAKREK
jgi:uncharacterized protein (DUF2062 family)